MNSLKTTVLLAAMMGLIIGLARVFGAAYGLEEDAARNLMRMALVMSGLMCFISYWFSDKIVLKMYKAQQIDAMSEPRLYNIVEKLANRAQMPMPKVYVIPTDSPNAFATGRSPSKASVAATKGIMRLLSDAELEGVMAHELAHVKNRDTLISTVAAAIGGAVSYLTNMMMWSSMMGGGRRREGGSGPALILSIVAMILAPLVAAMIQMAISRSREYIADSTGAKICGRPESLASALARLEQGVSYSPMPENMGSPATAHMCIVNSYRAGAVMHKLFSTHPPMEERIKRLRAMRV